MISNESSEVFHFDKWLDPTNMSLPDMDPRVMTIVSFRFESVPGDEYTQHELGEETN